MRGLFVATTAVVSAALLAGCGTGAAPATPATSSATAAPTTSHARATATHHPSATTRPAPTSKAAAGATGNDVSCGTIPAANGKQVTVVAKSSAAGVAGCTEAIDVLSEYISRAAAESQGTAHELTVQGWQCSTIDAASVPGGLVGCEKQGLTIRAVS